MVKIADKKTPKTVTTNSHGTNFCAQDLELKSYPVRAKDSVFLERDGESFLVVLLEAEVLQGVEVLQDGDVFLDREEVRDSSHRDFLDIDYAPLALGGLAR
jgi:hypothetical protein